MNRREFIKRGAVWIPAAPFILTPGKALADHLPHRRKAFRGAAASCPADGSPSAESDQTTESYRCGQTTDNRRTGLSAWNDGGVSRAICKLAFESTSIAGTVSGKTYNAFIYTMTAANLDALQATSNDLTGISAAGWHVFTFATPFVTGGASTPYALIFGPTAADASNYLWVPTNDSNLLTGYREQFSDAGTAQFGAGGTTDQSIRIYWLT